MTVISPETMIDRARGCLLAIACGDALGLPTEGIFSTEELVKRLNVLQITDMVSHRHGREGEYSDDTQQSLALARSIRPDGSFDLAYFASVELPLWRDYWRGAGYTSAVATRRLSEGTQWDENFFDKQITDRHGKERRIEYRSAGSNGTVMRVAPLALATPFDPDKVAQNVFRASLVTHGSPQAMIAAMVQAEAVRRLFLTGTDIEAHDLMEQLAGYAEHLAIPDGEDLQSWRTRWDSESLLPFEDEWNIDRAHLGANLRRIGEMHSMHDYQTLLQDFEVTVRTRRVGAFPAFLGTMLLYTLHNGSTADCLSHAANLLGSDTDTLGAMLGALCGVRDGGASLPERWLDAVQDREYIARVGEELGLVAAGHATKRPGTVDMDISLRDCIDALYSWSLARHERVNHSIFGPGTVQKVWVHVPAPKDATDKERKAHKSVRSTSKKHHRLTEEDMFGADSLYARVVFDSGLSARFSITRLNSGEE